MDAARWLSCNDPAAMLDGAHGKISARQLLLFGCACSRRIWGSLDEPERRLIEASEGFADDQLPAADLVKARSREFASTSAVYSLVSPGGTIQALAAQVADVRAKGNPTLRAEEVAAQAELLRDILSNPFVRGPAPLLGPWPSDVVSIARALDMGEAASFALRDALLERGFAELADHFQAAYHPKGCRALDSILGKGVTIPVVGRRSFPDLPGYSQWERSGSGHPQTHSARGPDGKLKCVRYYSWGVYSGHPGSVQRLCEEVSQNHWARRNQQRRHAHLVTLEYAEVQREGLLVLVTPWADRNLWDEAWEAQRQGLPGIPRMQLLNYVMATADAVDALHHRHGECHGNLKPRNLLLVDGQLQLDLNSFATVINGVTGGVTPLYAAPERVDGILHPASDQYSLALLYQELLTGRRPFNGTNVRQLLLQHLNETPDLSALPEYDRPVIARALAKKPGDRFSNCTEMVNALRSVTPPA